MINANLHRLMLTTVTVGILTACGMTRTVDPRTPADANVLLLGETHDNGEGHRLRVDALHARIEAGWRPAIAMEQFDREQQPALDAAMRDCADADCVVAKVVAGKSGWTWDFYKPVIALALAYKLPLLAANLSRADASKVVKAGVNAALPAGPIARYRLEALPAPLLAAQETEVRDSHCGMLPESMVSPMAKAQVARDVVMAETLRTHAADGVVLIAGNGHVRRDIAVPYWLRAQGVATWSIGYVEQTGAPGEFDREQRIPSITRPDPCKDLGKQMGVPPAKPAGG